MKTLSFSSSSPLNLIWVEIVSVVWSGDDLQQRRRKRLGGLFIALISCLYHVRGCLACRLSTSATVTMSCMFTLVTFVAWTLYFLHSLYVYLGSDLSVYQYKFALRGIGENERIGTNSTELWCAHVRSNGICKYQLHTAMQNCQSSYSTSQTTCVWSPIWKYRSFWWWCHLIPLSRWLIISARKTGSQRDNYKNNEHHKGHFKYARYGPLYQFALVEDNHAHTRHK